MKPSAEERLAMFIDGLNAAIWEYNVIADEAWWSDKMYDMLGYQPGEIDISKESFNKNILHPDDVDRTSAATELLVSNNKVYKSTYRLKHKALGYLWFESGGRIFYNTDGKPAVIYGTMINIHDKKMLEQRHALVIDGVEAGIWEWDILRNKSWWSDNFCHLLGYEPGELLPDNQFFIENILHPGDEKSMSDAIAGHLNSKIPYQTELRFKHKNGEYNWFACAGQCRFSKDGTPELMIGSAINIQGRKKAEEKLLYSEFFLNETGRISQTGGWELNMLTQTPMWTKTTYDIHETDYDYKPDLESAINFYHPDYREMINKAIAEAMEGQPFELELILITAKGNEKWVKAYGEPVYNDERDLIKLRGVFTDINDFKMAELSLNSLVKQLDKQNQQLKSFSHMLSHNLRNHAGNISLLTSMLSDTKNDEEEFDELSQNLTKVSQRLNQTLDDMSEGLKVKENTNIRKDHLLFSEITDSILITLQADMARLNAKVTTDFSVENIEFPKVYLESIITNLLSNALKYSKQDVDPVVKLSTYFTGNTNRVILECVDNGVGIDLDLHGDKMFKLYNVFHNHKDAHGVGLYLVSTQIESQGGSIEVKSTPGLGSRFIVKF